MRFIQKINMETFEYLVEHIDFSKLNALGANGWELVTIVPSGKAIFKRKKTKSAKLGLGSRF